MRQNYFLKRWLTLFFVTVFIVSFTNVSFAGKPSATTASLSMVTGDMSITMDRGTSKTFTVQAKYSPASSVEWSGSTDYLGFDLDVENSKNALTTATYTLKPTDTSESEAFEISATANGVTKTITVTVTLNPIIMPNDPPSSNSIKYVALGDSIATGTYYTSILTKYTNPSYVSQFSDYLATVYDQVETVNLSHDGDQTTQLLTVLNTSSAIVELQEADVITITIGANNLMQAAKTWLGTYNFSKIDWTKAEVGRALFEKDWPVVINRVKTIIKDTNPNAKILVMTIYNPYNSNESNYLEIDKKFTNILGNGINDVIVNNSSLGYAVVDVYTPFKEVSLNNNMTSLTYFYASFRDPHPRVAGHALISALHADVFIALE